MKEIFVFGSNLLGVHGAGAARFARQHYGAAPGIGAGRTGDAYAIPTKIGPYETMPLTSIAGYVATFLDYARAHPDLRFKLTRIGCGLAGYTDAQMAPMFRGASSNVLWPTEWETYK